MMYIVVICKSWQTLTSNFFSFLIIICPNVFLFCEPFKSFSYFCIQITLLFFSLKQQLWKSCLVEKQTLLKNGENNSKKKNMFFLLLSTHTDMKLRAQTKTMVLCEKLGHWAGLVTRNIENKGLYTHERVMINWLVRIFYWQSTGVESKQRR